MKKPIIAGLTNAVGAVAYIFIVSLFMRYGGKIFGNDNTFLGPVAFLTVFVLSAAIMGIIVFGRSVLLYLDNKRKEAILTVFYTLGWMVVAVIVFLLVKIL